MHRDGAKPYVLGLAILLAGAGVLSFGSGPAAGIPLTPHAPIFIDGNAAFTPANGVTGGSGTTADPYTIAGWVINASAANGIEIRNTNSSLRIDSVEIRGGRPVNAGLFLENVTNAFLTNVTSLENTYGILVRDSSNVTVERSTVSHNDFDGIAGTSSTIFELIQNNVTESGAYGIHLLATPFATVDRNTVSYSGRLVANGVDIFLEGSLMPAVSRNDISALGNYGVYASGSQGVNFWGNRVANHSVGLYLESSNDATVMGNELRENVQAVSVRSERAAIRWNEFTNNTNAVFIFESGTSWVLDNNVSTNGGFGVVLSYSVGDTIARNRFAHDGVLLFGNRTEDFASHTMTADNQVNGRPLRYLKDCAATVVDGAATGELVAANCTGIRISNLTIGQTDAAVTLAFVRGAEISGNLLWGSAYGVRLLSSSGVRTFHNAILNNGVSAADDGVAVWDLGYPDGGNFWSGYSGVDNCSGPAQSVCPDADGLGDTPYVLPGGIVDHFPLLRPWNATRLPMVAAFDVTPAKGDISTGYTFNASSSTDPNGPDVEIEVRWDWNADGFWDTEWTTTKTASHSFPVPGTHRVRLEIRDGLGMTANLSKDVVVGEGPVFLGLDVIGAGVLVVAIVALAATAIFLVMRRRGRRPPPENKPYLEPRNI